MDTNPWEAEAEWLRQQPNSKQLMIDCYKDEDIVAAAERFSKSEEFAEVRRWAIRYGSPQGGRVLDVGAGNGISAYAWAVSGYEVVALEPNPGSTTGAGAIRRLSKQTGVPIEIRLEHGEHSGLASDSFDLVYCREVLHHAADLGQMCCEAFRVLRPGGVMVATREHVIDGPEQLPQFLQQHPTHWLTGTEMAYTLSEYQRVLTQAGFEIVRTYGPMDTVVNYYPTPSDTVYNEALTSARIRLGYVIGSIVGRTTWWQTFCKAWQSHKSNSPGRLYSFIAVKPRRHWRFGWWFIWRVFHPYRKEAE